MDNKDKRDEMYSMNAEDGRIVFRNEQVDRQVNYYPIPYAVVELMRKKELDWKKVKEACEKKMKENGEIDIQEYLQKLKLLNVRKTKVVQPEDNESKVEDRSKEMISISDVAPTALKKEKTKTEKTGLDSVNI